MTVHSQSALRRSRSGLGDLSSPLYTCGLNGREQNGKNNHTRNGPFWEDFVKFLPGSPILKQGTYLEEFYFKLSERTECMIITSNVSHMGVESQMVGDEDIKREVWTRQELVRIRVDPVPIVFSFLH